ncbi:MAG: lamin tail domain-containing protein [Cyclobacteriaceae bacterium]|nr:lamin tail domain-containing protein [Cyclobacteriaceae bacterium]
MTSSLNKFGIVGFILLLGVGVVYFTLREELPELYINELLAGSTSCCPDLSSGTAEYDDWIEVFNAGSRPVNVGGMYFSENKKKPLEFQIPNSTPELTTIPPGGYLLFWADGSPEQGPLHLNFKLDMDGEYLGLFNKDGRKINDLRFEKQSENQSYGRVQDGTKDWKIYSNPTPSKPNQE